MFLPGQIENWVVIADLANQGLASLPKNELQGMAKIMGSNYRSRMGRTWVLNTSWATSMFWKVISSFIDPETTEKIHLTSKATHPDLKEFFTQDQLLEKYGGTAKKPALNWPPCVPES
jgi:hypothetical protein